MADSVETRSCPTRVTVPNLVALGQTVWAYVGVPNFGGRWGPCPLGWGLADPIKHATPAHNTVVISTTILQQ